MSTYVEKSEMAQASKEMFVTISVRPNTMPTTANMTTSRVYPTKKAKN